MHVAGLHRRTAGVGRGFGLQGHEGLLWGLGVQAQKARLTPTPVGETGGEAEWPASRGPGCRASTAVVAKMSRRPKLGGSRSAARWGRSPKPRPRSGQKTQGRGAAMKESPRSGQTNAPGRASGRLFEQ
jgi:hypothetical protein